MKGFTKILGGHTWQYKGGRDSSCNYTCVLSHLITSILQAACHVLAMVRVILGHHRRGLKSTVGNFSCWKLLMVCLLSRNHRSIRNFFWTCVSIDSHEQYFSLQKVSLIFLSSVQHFNFPKRLLLMHSVPKVFWIKRRHWY